METITQTKLRFHAALVLTDYGRAAEMDEASLSIVIRRTSKDFPAATPVISSGPVGDCRVAPNFQPLYPEFSLLPTQTKQKYEN